MTFYLIRKPFSPYFTSNISPCKNMEEVQPNLEFQDKNAKKKKKKTRANYFSGEKKNTTEELYNDIDCILDLSD